MSINRKANIPGKKYCLQCGELKPLEEFHLKGNKNYPESRNARCKDCLSKTSRRVKKPTKEGYKYCHACQTEKPVSEFYKDKSKFMGLSSSCKCCHKQKVISRGTNRYHEDSNYKIKKLLRARVRDALSGRTKSASTLKLLDCTIEELKTHLQRTAKVNGYQNFDIDNYSGHQYHIDHIIPCSSFDLSKEEDQQKCFHWSNLQILSARHNIIKGDK